MKPAARHPEELVAPGHAHEAAGEALLAGHGVPARVARLAGTHGRWDRPDVTVEELLARSPTRSGRVAGSSGWRSWPSTGWRRPAGSPAGRRSPGWTSSSRSWPHRPSCAWRSTPASRPPRPAAPAPGPGRRHHDGAGCCRSRPPRWGRWDAALGRSRERLDAARRAGVDQQWEHVGGDPQGDPDLDRSRLGEAAVTDAARRGGRPFGYRRGQRRERQARLEVAVQVPRAHGGVAQPGTAGELEREPVQPPGGVRLELGGGQLGEERVGVEELGVVPTARTRPASRTKIWSAMIAVDSRGAATSTGWRCGLRRRWCRTGRLADRVRLRGGLVRWQPGVLSQGAG